jgi:2'-deoxynucleoside 5'-phosphate N-hydrolase
MNIYFACSITGGREFEPVYQAIVAALESDGHTIPTSHLASAEVIDLEKIVASEDVFRRDIEWINAADALVAEVSTPSHGVGYEIAYALSIGKPVLCCYRAGQCVSKMLTGNTASNMRVQIYQTADEAISIVRAFLANGLYPSA